eukprot:TRINITY_DN4109_c0_g1_i2.p1 TRINITY_DN4109_c0_g1~~TRINITY_DN4109_c0_g1_i2.p1  ORF type:complete len:329 (-),score=60.88 TRINITY_DN4109_c0_g1_i2:28-1014(-)
MHPRVPFEAVGVKDFLVHPIEKGVEYTVLAISDDGSKFQARLVDGTLAWFPSKMVQILDTNDEDQKRREYEAQKREAQEKARRRQELQMKVQQQEHQHHQQTHPHYQQHQSQQHQPQPQVYSMQPQRAVQGQHAQARNRSNDEYLSGLLDEISITGSGAGPARDQARKAPSAPQVVSPTSTGVYRKVPENKEVPRSAPAIQESVQEQPHSGQWQCPSCASVHAAQVVKCNLCGTSKKSEFSIDEKVESSSSVWNCSSCKVENQPGRTTCIMCGNKYRPPPPTPIATVNKTRVDRSKSNPQRLVAKKKNIVSKAGAGIEIQYASDPSLK